MTTEFDVAGRIVRMPVVVRDALAASATFAVHADGAAQLVPPSLTLVRAWPGRALLTLTAVAYRDNDLGTYDELSIAFAVRQGVALGSYIHRLPVNEEFSCRAGHEIWSFPKTVEPLTVRRAGEQVTCAWDGVLQLAVDCRGRRRMPATAQRAYSVRDGVPQRTRFVMRATGFGIRPGGARLDLGTGAVADELRSLGLPTGALFSISMQHLQARFDAPHPVRG